MALLSFLKNLLGGDTATDVGGSYENLSGANFKKQLHETEHAVVLDVRTPAEFASGKLPKAKNLDFFARSFSEKVAQLDKNAVYFIYCKSGNRSGQAGKMMQKMGYDVRNLSGGIGQFPRG